MIIDRIVLRSEALGVLATLKLKDTPLTDPYILKASTGLDAGSILALYYGSSTTGNGFFEMVSEPRDIVLRIGLNPEYNSLGEKEDLRDALYKAIAPSRIPTICVDLYNGVSYIASISGLVSKLENSYFTATPEIQLTITCKQPIFKTQYRTAVNTVPFTSGSFSIDVVDGTAPTGFTMHFGINTPITLFNIQAPDGSWVYRIEHNFIAGDHLFISSEAGNRYIYVYNSLLVSSESDGITRIADKVAPNSQWPILFPGVNNFLITVNPLHFAYLGIEYFPSYWGV